jgi:hypothetical protein
LTFESPLMLFLLGAAALPVYLHLRRRRAQVVLLPTVRLLTRVVAQRKLRLRFQALLLLALRMAVIAAVVLSVAKTGVSVHRPGGLRTGKALAMILVMDDSLSMHYEASGQSSFGRARNLAMEELGRLRPGDAAGVVFTTTSTGQESASLSFDLERSQRAISGARAGFGRGDLYGAVERAAAQLRASPLPQREIVLLTDLTQGDELGRWPTLSSAAGIDFRVVDSGVRPRDGNWAISDIQIYQAADGSPEEVVIEAHLASFSDADKSGMDIALEVDGAEVARGVVDILAHGVAKKKFSHRFTGEGLHRGLVRIADDSLPQDNARHFSAIVRSAISVLVVDGDPRPGSHLGEVFYLERALFTQLPTEVSIRPVVLDADAASDAPFGGYDVIFLAGLQEPKAPLAERLLSYINEGGGVFISAAGGSSDMGLVESILPGRVVSVRAVPSGRKPYRILTVARDHPIFEPFGKGSTGLEQVQITRHMLVRHKPSEDSMALVELAGGLPLLLERRLGKGRVLFLATTIDREWTDLPIRPGYLPLVQRAARYLAGRLDEPRLPQLLVGNQVELEVTQGMQRLVVRDPSGTDTTFAASDLRGKVLVGYSRTFLPGHYRVWAEIPDQGGLQELDSHSFVVVTDPRESNPAQAISATHHDSDPSQSAAPIEGVLPIWPYLLIAAMLLLLCETLLCGYGLYGSHLKHN